MLANPLFFELYRQYKLNKYRYYILQGGARAGKTYAILQLLFYIATQENKNITVISISHTHLARGAMRDFINILNDAKLVENVHYKYNRSHSIFYFGKNFIEFVSVERSDKLRGSQRDIAFINEANLLDYDFFTEIDIRTRYSVFLDFNPLRRFWVHDKLSHLQHTYFRKVKTLENRFITKEQLKAFEHKLSDSVFRKAFWEGEVAEDNTLCFYNYNVVSNDVIKNATLLGVGIDIGLGRSPSAAVELYIIDDKYIAHEVFYNVCNYDVLCSFLHNKYRNDYKKIVILADNAQKDFINIARAKYNIPVLPTTKISLDASFSLLNMCHINITDSSINLLAEAASLRWENKNTVGNKHAIDALRYVLHNFLL